VEGSGYGGVILRDKDKERDHFSPANGPTIIAQSSIVTVSGDSTITTAISTNTNTATSSTPRLAIKGFRQKIGKAITNKESKGNTPSGSTTRNSSKESEQYSSTNGSSSKGSPASSSKTQADAKTKLDSSTSTSQTIYTNGNSGGQSILRQQKPSSTTGNSRDNRNRFSATGIPTRNSLIVTNNNSTSRDELHKSPNSLAYDSSSVHSSMSSISGLGGQPANGTGIPKPTAAVKGTSKQQLSNNKDEKAITSVSKSVMKDNQSKGILSNKPSDTNPQYTNSSKSERIPSSVPEATVTTKKSSMSSENSNSSNQNETEKIHRKGELEESSSGNLNKSSTISNNTTQGGLPSKSVDNGVTVAMVAPMPSLSNSVSNSASASSVESSSLSLSHSQISSLSQSNSSEVSVIHVKGPPHLSTSLQESKLAKESTPNECLIASTGQTNGDSSEITTANVNVSVNSSGESPNKVSPMSVYGTGSGSSSMGSLKCAADTSSGASSSGEGNGSCNSGDGNRHCNTTDISPSNGNDVIPECDEDELLLNVTPMEPLNYQYMKSPPSGHITPGFLSPKSGPHCGNGIQLPRMGKSLQLS